MKKSTTLMIIIGLVLFGLMFGLSFCNNGETIDESPEAYEVTANDFEQPQVRTIVPTAPLQSKDKKILCNYIVYVTGNAVLAAHGEVIPNNSSAPDNYTARVPIPFRVATTIQLDSLPLLSTDELEALALDALPNGGSPGPEWTFLRWKDERGPEFYHVNRKCTKDIQKEQPVKVSR